jgi:pimeloyl-ACP methyl ester carboxylesterase
MVMVHWLGGSASSWHKVSEGLAAQGMRCVAVDLPGFGHASVIADFSIPSMVGELIDTIRSSRMKRRKISSA